MSLQVVNDLRNGPYVGQPRALISPTGFSVIAWLLDVAAIMAAAIISGLAYHAAAYGNIGAMDAHVAVGGITVLTYTLPLALRDGYCIQTYIEGHRDFRRTFFVWNTAILFLAIIGFLTKYAELVSRGAMVVFYCFGLFAVIGTAIFTRSALLSLIASGYVASRRIMLVGPERQVRQVQEDISRTREGVQVVTSQILPMPEIDDLDRQLLQRLKPFLYDAILKARSMDVDDVVLLVEWSRTNLIEGLIEAFRVLPVSIHLGASGFLGRFSDARVSRLSGITALSLTTPPLAHLEGLTKRTLDVVVSLFALVVLSPLFAVIALAIKLTSPGPVFFRQRRRGYNMREFRIWKFRTMTTLDDGSVIVQAQADDVRVTPIGRFLRRYNLDELPQLINVLIGQMSLVGPRPHAVCHDKEFEERILHYPRRLSMRPGITGWAQVNGLRGPTETEDKMRARVNYDLFYIDNFSITFDIYILFLTVLSPKAYRNAF